MSNQLIMNFIYEAESALKLRDEISKKYLDQFRGISDRKDLPSLLNN